MRTKSLLQRLHLTPQKPHIHALPAEILQEIFSYLDIISLARAHTTCTRWATLIPGSSPALQSIFLFSSTLAPHDTFAFCFDYELASHVTLSSFDGPEKSIPVVTPKPTPPRSMDAAGVALHPAIWWLHARMQPRVADPRVWPNRRFSLEGADGGARGEWPPVELTCVEHAWATKPPVVNLRVGFRYRDLRMQKDGWEGEQYHVVRKSEGIRLRDLWRLFERRVEVVKEEEEGWWKKWRVKGVGGG